MTCKLAARNLSWAEYAQYIDPDPAASDSQYAKHPTCPELPTG